jgi:hypothetical protein
VQFSLFGAEAAEPLISDLDGLVLCGGEWVRSEHGTAASLSVLVGDRWRSQALVDEFERRGLGCEVRTAPGALISIRTGFSGALIGQAERWRTGSVGRVPLERGLTASGLRLWTIAAGRRDEHGFLLGVDDDSGELHRMAGAQLARLGIASVAVGLRGGPGWRVTSMKRLRRLAELVGQGPDGAGWDWPTTDVPA